MGVVFFRVSAHYIIQSLWFCSGHLPGQGLFCSGFPHTTSSSCSGFARDIYPDTGVVFFGLYAHYIIQMLQPFLGHLPRHGGCFFRVFRTLDHPVAPVLLGTFIRTQGLFFSGFPHTASSSCSGFSRDIYPDTGVVFFGFSAHCIIQLLQFCSGHLPGHRSGFFSGFLHTASSSCSSFAWDIYPDTGVVFSGFPHTTSFSCSGFARDIYPDTGVVFSGFPHTTSSRCSGSAQNI